MDAHPIQVSGTVQGKTIILEGNPNLPDGTRVTVTVLVEQAASPRAALLARPPSQVPADVWDNLDTAIQDWDRDDREQARNR